MKKIFRNLMILLCALTALVSCDESGDKIYLDGFKASDLMASASDVVLSVDNTKDIVLSMAWQNPSLLSSDETKPAGNGVLKTYLQASPSENFATVKEYSVTDLSKAFSGADLNTLAKDLGTTPGQSAPLYFRIKSQMGNNLDAAYSNVCQVNVTPYIIHMNKMTIWNADKNKELTYLYSPNEDGIYAGYMNASSWLNFWGKVITTTADNTPISIVATGAEYSKATATDDAAAVVKTMNYTLADGKMTDAAAAGSVNIAKAGTYTITVKVGENSDLTYSIESGNQTAPEPEASNTLCMFSKDGNTLLAVMNKVSDGVYTCKYKPTSWENFRFIFVGENKDDKQTWYGADGEQFKLTSGDGAWDIWFGDENGETEFTVTADLNTMTWKYE